jgi:hypothetical protein
LTLQNVFISRVKQGIMRRRTVLASFTAGIGSLAGCNTTLGVERESPTTSPTESPTPTADDPDEDEEWEIGAASIIDLTTANRTYALAPLSYDSDDGAHIRARFSSTATPEGPATVEATLTNENPFENTFRLEWTPPFGRLFSDVPRPMGERCGDSTYRVELIFAPTANHDLVENPTDIQRADDGYWRLAAGTTPYLPERVRLAPDETIHGEYALVGHAEGTGRGRPPGVYEFSRAGERPLRVTVWPTDSPGPATDSQLTGVSVPDLPGDSDTAWFHDTDASVPTFVRPSVERTDLPAGIEFTFINRSRQSTGCGHWNFYKLQDAEWFHLGPFVHTSDCRNVSPGGTKTWTLRAAAGGMAPCQAQSYPFLGGGRYATIAGYGHATAQSGALVEIDAPPVTVVPTDDVTTQRDGETVTATSERWRTAPDAEGHSRVSLALETVGDADRRLIAEQVMRRRDRGYRNTLAFVTADVARVVLRTDDRTADRTVGYDDGTTRFEYEEQAYRITRRTP